VPFTTTANIGLRKADPNDFYDVEEIANFNADILDAAIGPDGGGAGGVTICTSTTRPTTPVPGQKIFETDTFREWLYTNTWRQTSGPRKPVVLTYQATMISDCSLGTLFRATLTGDAQIGVPTNAVDGMDGVWELTASGGARNGTFASGVGGFVFGGDITGVTAIGSGLTDIVGAKYHQPTQRWRVVSYAKGYPVS
jgi:hypothetical protein